MQLDYYIIMCTLQSLTLTSFSRKMAMSEVSRSGLGSKVLGQHAEGPYGSILLGSPLSSKFMDIV